MGDDLALDTGYPDLQDHLRLSTSTSRVASVDKRSATILGGGPAPGRGAGPAEPITCYCTTRFGTRCTVTIACVTTTLIESWASRRTFLVSSVIVLTLSYS